MKVIRDSKFSNDPKYFDDIKDFKEEEKVKAFREVNPNHKKEEKKEEIEIEASVDSNESDNNPEIEDYEEKEVNRKFKDYKGDK